jgi:hypothetical protein
MVAIPGYNKISSILCHRHECFIQKHRQTESTLFLSPPNLGTFAFTQNSQ